MFRNLCVGALGRTERGTLQFFGQGQQRLPLAHRLALGHRQAADDPGARRKNPHHALLRHQPAADRRAARVVGKNSSASAPAQANKATVVNHAARRIVESQGKLTPTPAAAPK